MAHLWCFTCINVSVVQSPLCSGSICVGDNRAAKVGQGHGSIIDLLPSLFTAYYGCWTIKIFMS